MTVIKDNPVALITGSAHRIGESDDIAETVAFLAKADYVTGQIIAVDGGRLVHI